MFHCEMSFPYMLLRLRYLLGACVVAAFLTYVSLLAAGRGVTLCENLGTPIYCDVLAYGFPFPYLADSRAFSPTGSVGRDPLSILIGEDDILWAELCKSFLFWLFVVLVGILILRRSRRD